MTIQNVGLESRGQGLDYLASDSMRKGPLEVAEGKAQTYFMEQSGLDLDKIKGAIVVDQTGRTWRCKRERRRQWISVLLAGRALRLPGSGTQVRRLSKERPGSDEDGKSL